MTTTTASHSYGYGYSHSCYSCCCYARTPATPVICATPATHRSFYTHQAFTHRSLYTQQAFTQRSFYTQHVFTQRSFSHTASIYIAFHTQQAFTYSKHLHTASFYTQQAFTHSRLSHPASSYTEVFQTEAVTHRNPLRCQAKSSYMVPAAGSIHLTYGQPPRVHIKIPWDHHSMAGGLAKVN